MQLANPKTLRSACDYLMQNDVVLRQIIQEASLPTIEPHDNYYSELVSSIISQQLSVKAASTIQGRFESLFGGKLPAPEAILSKSIDDLRNTGLSRPKANYIRDLAEHILDGKLKFDEFDELSNEEITAELIDVKGIGEWTAHMFLIFCMGRLDVLPTGDLGIRNGVGKLYGYESIPTSQEVRLVADKNNWHPYESVASWYIWHSLDNQPNS